MTSKKSRLKIINLVLLLMICTISILVFSACSNENTKGTNDSQNSNGNNAKQTLTFKTLRVEGNTVSAVVRNSQDTFDFNNEVSVSKDMKFAVSKDEFGSDKVLTKIVPLQEGDNVVYILGLVDDEVVKTYTVTIHRNAMFSVTFYNDDKVVERKSVEEGNLVEEPTKTPSNHGFEFARWDYDFSKPITKDTDIRAVWTGGQNSVVLENNGGIGDSLISYVTGVGATLPILTKTDCEFMGWYSNPDFSGDEVKSIGVNESGTKHFYAKWRAVLTYEDLNTYQVAVTGLKNGDVHEIFIPSKYNGKYVVKINDNAFECNGDNAQILSVTISEGVESIGTSAFYRQSSIKEVELPSSLTSINDFAFEFCSSLTEITIPKGVTKISTKVFSHCTSLKTVVLSDYVTEIGAYAFDLCNSLENINIPKKVKKIGEFAFNCTKIKSFDIPEGITTIERGTFSSCNNLKYIVIPASLTTIKEHAFNFNLDYLLVVYYKSKSAAKKITVSPDFNDGFGRQNFYFYQEIEPELNENGTGYIDGSLWHYDENGKPVIWRF